MQGLTDNLWKPSSKLSIMPLGHCFPVLISRGEHFHHCQCLERKFKKRFTENLNENSSLKGKLHILNALPSLPLGDVESAWIVVGDHLLAKHTLTKITKSIVAHYDTTWMTGSYPVEMWNCYGRTLKSLPGQGRATLPKKATTQ